MTKDKNTLFIYLHSLNPLIGSWILYDEHQQFVKSGWHQELSLAALPESTHTLIVLPGTDISLTEVVLPKLNQYRLHQALPFALEDQLVEDITDLHFAAGSYVAEKGWPTAIINTTTLSTYLSDLAQINIYPTAVLPAALMLPFSENQWTLFCLDQLCLIKIEDHIGFAIEKENALAYLTALKKTHSPAEIHVYSSTPFELGTLFSCPVQEHLLADSDLLKKILTPSATQLNLLQGKFRPKQTKATVKKRWLQAACLLLGALIISFMSSFFSWIILSYQERKIEHQILVIYQQHFPQATALVTPLERLNTQFKQLKTQTSNSTFLFLLEKSANALSENNIRLLNLRYQDKELTLDLSATSFERLDQLMKALKQQPLNVRQENAETTDNGVKATLQISAGHS